MWTQITSLTILQAGMEIREGEMQYIIENIEPDWITISRDEESWILAPDAILHRGFELFVPSPR